jgi:hypothetical protein
MRTLFSLAFWLVVASSIAAAESAPSLPDGTLLFLENCSSVVERTTKGEIAHVAIIFRGDEGAFVYEATPAKVRRVKLDDYLTELARINNRHDEDDQVRAVALAPQPAYTVNEIDKMRTHLDGQLNRRYSVKGYVRGKPSDGIHCAELASTTLNQSGRYKFEDCHKINPQALYKSLLPTHLAPSPLSIPPIAIQESWWLRAKRRSVAWGTWCGWSCREAWLFCW